MSRRLEALTILLALATAACSTLEVNTDYDPGTDFSTYKTFTVVRGASSKESIAMDRLVASLSTAAEARGLRRVESGGDLNLHTHLVLGQDTQFSTTGYGYAGWGGWRWGGGMQTTTVQQIPTGTLVVDLVDAKTSKAVWRGIAKDQISKSATPEDRQQKANEVAKALFETYPPGPKK